MSTTSENLKTGMMKSHLERLAQIQKSYPAIFNRDYEVHGTEDVVLNGRIVKQSCVVKVHPQDKFKGLKADDFALENVIAVGALDSLNECYLGSNSLSELSDSMEGTIDNMIDAVNAAEANVESSNND